jgi:hypothetical protein
MDHAEAGSLLTAALAPYRAMRYAELVPLVNAPKRTTELPGASGARYCVDIVIDWDADAGGNLRVIGAIDDGGWRAFMPMSDSFIKAPDGSFVGEGRWPAAWQNEQRTSRDHHRDAEGTEERTMNF